MLVYFVAYFVYYKDEPGFSAIRLFSTLLMLMSGVIVAISNVKKALTFCAFEIWLIVFIFVGFFTMLWTPSSSTVVGILMNLVRILIVAYFVRIRVRSEEDLQTVLLLYVIATLYMVIYVFMQMADMYTWEQILVRRFGDQFEYNSNQTAVQCCFSILILTYFVKCKKKKIVSWGLMLFFVFILLLTQSKKGVICLVLGVFIAYYSNATGAKRARRVVIAIIGTLITYLLITNIPFLYNLVGYRLEDLIESLMGRNLSMGEDSRRIELLETAIDTWLTNPLIGVGLANFSIVNFGISGAYAHNNYLELLADVGLIGTAIYYSLPFCVLAKRYDKHDYQQVLLHTIVIILLVMDVAVVSYANISMMIFYALALIKLEHNGCSISTNRNVIMNK